ncbi:MAG: hypothetical protein NVS9B15_08800 [Acidobacteriaceae bacterium]
MRMTIPHLVLMTSAIALTSPTVLAQSASDHPVATTLARGAGTTIIAGGTGKPGGYLPVETTIAFHAEKTETGSVSGDFECLARIPPASAGPGSGHFTINAMYVTGQIKAAVILGETATLSGIAEITGLGAGTSIPFTLVVRKGGPGSTAQLTTSGASELVFHEILLQGTFEVFSQRHADQ